MRDFTNADREAMRDPLFAHRYQRDSVHDARLDGCFVTGHPMSETFCRPGCSMRTPRPSRVVFYPTSAAAHAHGLAPCPRCRPDSTCAPPELARSDALGARAWRLILDGQIDRTGVGGLAKALGVTTRHVLRAVESVAGCGPLDVARAERAHLARVLLTATTLPMGAVATAAGFATVRQFNATIARFYRVTPTALRFGGRRRTGVADQTRPLVLRCSLPVRRPFDAAAVFGELARTAIPEVEGGGDHWYARTLRLPHGAGHARVDSDGRGGLLARLSVMDLRDLAPLRNRIRRLLDLDAEPASRALGAADVPEMIIRCIVEQDLAEASARTVLGGLANGLGDATPWGLQFPSPEAIAAQGRSVLRGSTTMVDTVVAVARAMAEGRLDVHLGWGHEQLVSAIMVFPGIGLRTAQRATRRVLGQP